MKLRKLASIHGRLLELIELGDIHGILPKACLKQKYALWQASGMNGSFTELQRL